MKSEEIQGDIFSMDSFALSVPVLTKSNTLPGDLELHIFRVALALKEWSQQNSLKS